MRPSMRSGKAGLVAVACRDACGRESREARRVGTVPVAPDDYAHGRFGILADAVDRARAKAPRQRWVPERTKGGRGRIPCMCVYRRSTSRYGYVHALSLWVYTFEEQS